MNKLLLSFVIFSCVLTSCQENDDFEPNFQVEEGTLFYFPGIYDNLQHFPLLYNYSNGSFNDVNRNYLKAQDFKLLTKSTLEVKVMDYDNNFDYVLAKEITIKYNEYGSYSDGPGVYNGLWRNTKGGYPRDFLLAINSELQEVVILFLETEEIFRKKYEVSNDKDGFLVISIDAINLGYGPEQWNIKRNYITSDLNTGVASLYVLDEGDNTHGYLNAIELIDNKK